MTGVAFVLFTNYMITDPGTTPMKARAQFMFGSAVAVVYGVMMELNITYTLFFALVVVCLIRGFGWWGVALLQRMRSRSAPDPATLHGEVDTRTLEKTDLKASQL